MSRKTKKPARRVLPGIILVLVCAGLAAVLLQPYFRKRPLANDLRESASQAASVFPGDNGGSNLTSTNPPATQDLEDQVVALTAAGNELLAQGNHAGAANKFAQAVAISPDQEDLHYNLAIALAKLGKTAEAKKHYEEAIRIFPDYAEAHNNLGNLLMNENKLDEAVVRFREAIKHMPENGLFHNNLGTVFGRQGKVPEAIVEFEEAIRHTPTYVEARVNLANAFLATNRVEEAIAQLNEALRLKPDFAPALQAKQRAQQRQAAGEAKK